MRAPVELYLASSNPGKVAEFRALGLGAASHVTVALELLPQFDSLPEFDENAPTFAENAAGKALHYSRFHEGLVFAEDSGLVAPVLGGAPGVQSARYAGPTATSEQRIAKLIAALRGKAGKERRAYFVCAIALAKRGRAMAIVTDRVDGNILETPRGNRGFGYDPIFYLPRLHKTFAELTAEDKNEHSHRGKAFRRLLAVMGSSRQS